MSYTAKHKAAGRYGVVDKDGNWLADFLGSKDEAEAKANELNQGDSKDNFVDSSENTNVENQADSSKKDDAGDDDSRAHAHFGDSENQASSVVPETAPIKQSDATDHSVGRVASGSVKKKPVLTDKGWIV
ncbi:hypothetical protein DM558_00395 [Entomomonas moraniae]|uniref:Uncharacterized protein n=1 Tax=Entomomonas moraniae TaxID=2213226 RepID=A0A3Q9JH05_9GAMM|nr:hypothetical protein [Entomomonas moraniae]AZS49329.1 hypothetical protein DM558_00395 [Entomomonas moraniae]